MYKTKMSQMHCLIKSLENMQYKTTSYSQVWMCVRCLEYTRNIYIETVSHKTRM